MDDITGPFAYREAERLGDFGAVKDIERKCSRTEKGKNSRDLSWNPSVFGERNAERTWEVWRKGIGLEIGV